MISDYSVKGNNRSEQKEITNAGKNCTFDCSTILLRQKAITCRKQNPAKVVCITFTPNESDSINM